MMKTIVAGGLLASAFAPVVALVLVVRLGELGLVGWLSLLACLFALVFLLVVLRKARKIQRRTIQTTSVRHADEATLTFAATYVIPVVIAALENDNRTAMAATVGLILLLALIYVRAGLFHLNPALSVLGYRLYEVTEDNGATTMMLTRSRHLPQAGPLRCRYIGDHVAIQIGNDDGP